VNFVWRKKIGAGDHPRAIGGSQPLADSGFEVMTALVGGIDGPETRAQRQFDQGRSAILLPCGAVEEVENGRR